MKTKTVCVCRYALIDKYTGSLSVIGILNELKSTNLPLMIPRVCLVLVSERQEGDPKQIELELLLKLNKKLITKSNIKIDYLDQKQNNCIFSIHGIVVEQAGILSFILKKDNKQIAKYECPVDIQPKIKEKK